MDLVEFLKNPLAPEGLGLPLETPSNLILMNWGGYLDHVSLEENIGMLIGCFDE